MEKQTEEAIIIAINELTTQWGYRNITELLRKWYQYQGYAAFNSSYDSNEPDYLCVLQTPEGGPIYCSSTKRLYQELQKCRSANRRYELCPAPDPTTQMWRVVGNFELVNEDDEEIED